MTEPITGRSAPSTPSDERMRRLRVGITGLAGVLVLVLLATAIGSAIRRSAASSATVNTTGSVAAAANTTEGSAEPLAQLGVAPGVGDKTGHAIPRRR